MDGPTMLRSMYNPNICSSSPLEIVAVLLMGTTLKVSQPHKFTSAQNVCNYKKWPPIPIRMGCTAERKHVLITILERRRINAPPTWKLNTLHWHMISNLWTPATSMVQPPFRIVLDELWIYLASVLPQALMTQHLLSATSHHRWSSHLQNHHCLSSEILGNNSIMVHKLFYWDSSLVCTWEMCIWWNQP